MSRTQILVLVAPLILIQLGLMVLALRDLLRPERKVLGGSKAAWAVAIVLGELLGPIAYFVFGRQES